MVDNGIHNVVSDTKCHIVQLIDAPRFWFWGFGFGVLVLGFWFWGFGFGVLVLGFWFWGFGFGVLVLGFWFWGFGFDNGFDPKPKLYESQTAKFDDAEFRVSVTTIIIWFSFLMAYLNNVFDVVASSFPSPVVVWIDHEEAFKTHLSSIIVSLRKQVTLQTFTETYSALEAMSTAVISCQNQDHTIRKQRIACVITNMKRRHPLSGLLLLQKMKSVFPTNILTSEFSSFPPTIVYSASTVKDSSLAEKCKAAGAMLVLSNNIDEVRRIIIESVTPSISLNYLLNSILEQKTILSNIPLEYYSLFSSHCLKPLPDKYGGKLARTHASQLLLLEWRLLYDVILNDTLKTFQSYCASDKHYIGGGVAINHWLNLHGFPPLLTSDCDFRFENKKNVEMYAKQMKLVLEKYTQIIRVNMARLGLICGDPELSRDNKGYRVYLPLRYYSSSTTTSEYSYYEFMWKIFDVSHNWKGNPIDIIPEHGLCYIGENEILKELTINYGEHKEQRRQIRLQFIKFVLYTVKKRAE
ncbi:unnamed protein product [Rotaria magnacalcarata]